MFNPLKTHTKLNYDFISIFMNLIKHSDLARAGEQGGGGKTDIFCQQSPLERRRRNERESKEEGARDWRRGRRARRRQRWRCGWDVGRGARGEAAEGGRGREEEGEEEGEGGALVRGVQVHDKSYESSQRSHAHPYGRETIRMRQMHVQGSSKE